jgi:hypothetical protein
MRLAALTDLLAPRQPRVEAANSSSWSAPPLDPTYAVPVPFVCGYDDGRVGLDLLNKARVTQCALSRICGACGGGLDRLVAFVGTPEEDGRNAFHFPPLHARCAEALRSSLSEHGVPLAGQPETSEVVQVTCAAFEFVRPASTDTERRPTFAPVR